MEIEREKLLSILLVVKPGLANRAIVEQATHFIFTGKRVVTYNDQICISHPLRTDFIGSIAAEEFYKVLSGMKGNKVEMIGSEEQLKIKSDGLSAGLALSSDKKVVDKIDALDIPKSNSKKWKPLSEDFIKGLFLCMFSASKLIIQNHEFLSSIFVDKDVIFSSDSLRISKYEMGERIKDSFLVPLSSTLELVKFKDLTDYYLRESWLYFITSNDVVFCSRRSSYEYPNLDHHFNFDGIKVTLPEDLKDSVDAVSIMAEGEFDADKKIDVSMSKGKINCRGEKEIGWIESESEMTFKRKNPINFTINPVFFSEILKMSLSMRYGEDRVMFKSENFTHLISLVV